MLEKSVRGKISLVLTLCLAVVTAALWQAGGASVGAFTDGVYFGAAEGFMGPIELEVTVEGGRIKAIDVIYHSETPGVSDPAFEKVIPAIIQSQQTSVDTVSGATYTSKGIMAAVEAALASDGSTPFTGLADGVYEGAAEGFMGPIEVKVTVSSGQISDIEVVYHSDTPGISDPAFEQVIPAIIKAQSTDVDVVSGATYTSKGIMAAVEDALSNPPAVDGVSDVSVDAEKVLVDGTVYEGSAEGFMGPVEVAVTVKDGNITNIEVVYHSDTPGISDPAFEKVIPAIIESQSTNVDVVSGATYTSQGIIGAVEAALAQANLGAAPGSFTDGEYEGSAEGFMGPIEVKVTVSNGRISAIDIVYHDDTPGISDPAFEKVVPAIIEAQSTDVDVVSGATYTSKGIINAVKDALGLE